MVAEVVIRGVIASRRTPVEGCAIGSDAEVVARGLARDGSTAVEDVIAQLDAARGAAAVLLHLDSPGGLDSRSLVQAVRSLPCPTVCHVTRAWSAAPLLALACGHVVLEPGAHPSGSLSRIAVHGPRCQHLPRNVWRPMAIDLCEALAARSGLSAGSLMRQTYDLDEARGDPPGTNAVCFRGDLPLRLGLADYVGSLADARALALALARGARPFTRRQAILAERLQPATHEALHARS